MENVTYQQLEAANKTIIKTDIKGKEYADVAQRIKAFRMVYPSGWIKTEIVRLDNGVCTITAKVGTYGDDGMTLLLGVGHAQEKESSSYINKTSYVENCETSAVGRALGMAGFGIDTSVCSADELSNALAAQSEPKPRADKLQAESEETAVEADVSLTEEEKAAVESARIILRGVKDVETANMSIKALQSIKHTENSRKEALKLTLAKMFELGLTFDKEHQCYKLKEAAQ